MNALVSGQAKTALLIDGDIYRSFHLYSPENLSPRRKSDFRNLFGAAVDLRFIRNTNPEAALKELRSDSDKASALNLLLMLLDKGISDAKPSLADALEGLLEEKEVSDYLESIFYAKPLPEDADTERALRLCRGAFTKTHAWLSDLVDRQDDIAFVSDAWDRIPAAAFADEERRADFQRAFVHERVFRDLVLFCHDTAKIDSLSSRIRALKSVTSLSNFRSVLQDLFRPFSHSRDYDEEKRLRKDEKEESVALGQKGNQSLNQEVVTANAKNRIDSIIESLKKRDRAFERKLSSELIMPGNTILWAPWNS